MDAVYVIKKPLVTEKSTDATEHDRYTFLVAREANKTEIKQAVQDLYKVRVLNVSTHLRSSRDRRMRYGKVAGKTTKRAIVRIHPDDRIELF